MHFRRHPLGPWRAIVCGWLAMATVSIAAEDMRFSQSLTAGQRLEIGIQRLTSDQLAILDALIRRDENWYMKPGAIPPMLARFSQRLSPEERRSAGLETLNEVELIDLDVFVAQIEFGTVPAPRAGKSADAAPQPRLRRPALEFHGMLSFSVGGGSGGYSEMGGAMAFMVDDPAHDLSVSFDYQEMHAKGPLVGSGCDPFFRAPPNAFALPEH